MPPPTQRPNKQRERAAATRARIIDAARELFIEQGYGATVLPDIAARAGVAVQTIYFVFGNKRTLLKEAVDVAIAGDAEPLATMERPWFQAVLEAASAAESLERYVAGTGDILRRIAPIARVLSAAVVSEPEIKELWPQDSNPRLAVVTRATKALMGKPGARADVPVKQAAEVIYALLSPDMYLVLTQECKWPHQRWQKWVLEILRQQLISETGRVALR